MLRVQHRIGLGLLGVVTIAGTWVGFDACLAPTQVKVEIHTLGIDCRAEVKSVAIAVGKSPEGAETRMKVGDVSAETQHCESATYVGSIVVTPDGDSGAIVVAARLGDAPCRAPDYTGCIVARRRFSFARRATLTLPITLEGVCRNVPCGPNESCRGGVCVSAETDCRADGTCQASAEPPPIVPPVDAGPDADVRNNLCPTPTAEIDCGPDANNCCKDLAQGNYRCAINAANCGAPSPYYRCVGAKHCAPGTYCCHTPQAMATGSTSASATSSSSSSAPPPGPWSTCSPGPCGDWLCNTDADCPPTMHCKGTLPGSAHGGRFLKMCTP
jgi:hypothetical protein